MARKPDDDDQRVSLEGLDPEAALKALLAVDPDSPLVDADRKPADAEPAERDESR